MASAIDRHQRNNCIVSFNKTKNIKPPAASGAYFKNRNGTRIFEISSAIFYDVIESSEGLQQSQERDNLGKQDFKSLRMWLMMV